MFAAMLAVLDACCDWMNEPINRLKRRWIKTQFVFLLMILFFWAGLPSILMLNQWSALPSVFQACPFIHLFALPYLPLDKDELWF